MFPLITCQPQVFQIFVCFSTKWRFSIEIKMDQKRAEINTNSTTYLFKKQKYFAALKKQQENFFGGKKNVDSEFKIGG